MGAGGIFGFGRDMAKQRREEKILLLFSMNNSAEKLSKGVSLVFCLICLTSVKSQDSAAEKKVSYKKTAKSKLWRFGCNANFLWAIFTLF